MTHASILLDGDGRISGWSSAAQALFALDDSVVRGADVTHLAVDPSEMAGLLARMNAKGEASAELALIGTGGKPFPASVSLVGMRMQAGALTTVVVTPLGAGDAHYAAQFVSILQSAMDAIITVDETQRIVIFNAAAEAIFGCPATEALQSGLERFIPERLRAGHRAHVERFAHTGVTTRRMGDQTVLTGLRSDGTEFPIEASISQVNVAGRRLYTVILRDVTERKLAAEQLEESNRRLRSLYESMHEVREAERTRIARELHDELAQWLTALKIDAAWLGARVTPEQAPLAVKIEKMKKAVDTAVASVRRIAADLRPVMLDDLGLVAAVEHLLHEFSERSGMLVSLNVPDMDFEVHDPQATAVYRMVQEALTNTSRHAAATRVTVGIRSEGAELVVRVTDNGKGIDPTAPRERKSFGLLGIRERATTLGGEARIYSPPEGGTVVDIRVPFAHGGGERR